MDNTLLVILLKNLVILPLQEIKIELKDEISKKIIKVSSKKFNDKLLVVSPTPSNSETLVEDLPNVGCLAHIKNKLELSNGNLRLTLKGEKRVNIVNYESFSDDIISAQYVDIILPKFEENGEEVIRKKLREVLQTYVDNSPNISNSILKTVTESDDLSFLTDAIATFLPLDTNKKIHYMQELNSEKRALSLIKDIKLEINYAKLEEKIDNLVEMRLSREQEEYYVKEKIKELENSIGLTKEDNGEVDAYFEKLASLDIPLKTSDKLKAEINKLASMTTNSPEYSVLRNYLDLVLNLPWNITSKETLNVKTVLNSLNKSHYGLKKVKERIEDYINLKNIQNQVASPVICLVGPPGVGKTTISESIASALNREFYKISVAGLSDALELTGSRRTYLGALPGKIIQGLRKCNTNNPVILIDEVDKMVKDYKGDPASALLDILDSTQNKTFVDNYVEEPFDLSNVLFILTANNVENIPYALVDRMDIIEISSYSVFEKIDIAKKYLIPKIYNELMINKKVTIKDEIIKYIINNYTKEAGVRNLYRILKKLITKVFTLNTTYSIGMEEVKKYLQDEIYNNQNKEIKEPGIVNGLAYTNFGGSTLRVECSLYNGEEQIVITGMLGDVLQESVKVAISYIKEKNYISNTLFYNHTIHIHLLDAATKKEGPSCGIAITTAIISRLLDIKVSNDIAFTGEITLKGDILKVGGLKEKLMAAFNDGIKTVYIPKDNENDLKEIDSEILESLEIKCIENYEQIFSDLFNVKK